MVKLYICKNNEVILFNKVFILNIMLTQQKRNDNTLLIILYIHEIKSSLPNTRPKSIVNSHEIQKRIELLNKIKLYNSIHQSINI